MVLKVAEVQCYGEPVDKICPCISLHFVLYWSVIKVAKVQCYGELDDMICPCICLCCAAQEFEESSVSCRLTNLWFG